MLLRTLHKFEHALRILQLQAFLCHDCVTVLKFDRHEIKQSKPCFRLQMDYSTAHSGSTSKLAAGDVGPMRRRGAPETGCRPWTLGEPIWTAAWLAESAPGPAGGGPWEPHPARTCTAAELRCHSCTQSTACQHASQLLHCAELMLLPHCTWTLDLYFATMCAAEGCWPTYGWSSPDRLDSLLVLCTDKWYQRVFTQAWSTACTGCQQAPCMCAYHSQ